MSLLHLERSVPSPRATDERAADAAEQREVVAIRAWARSRGYPIDETAGVPLTVLRTYRRLHPC